MVSVRAIQAHLVAGSRLLCYLSRSQLGVLLPFLTVELGLSTADQGYLMSRYASGYLLTQVLGGLCADRLGGYPVLASVMFLSGLCCLAAPLLAAFGTRLFGASFFVLGFIQGAAMPAGSVVSARWLLPEERSWATSISAIGTAIGCFTINACAAPVASFLGWQAVFCGTAVLFFAFTLLWLWLGSSSPTTSRYITHDELRILREAGVLPPENGCNGKVVAESASKGVGRRLLPPVAFFFHGCVWTLFLAHFAQNWQQYFTEWLPLFYTSKLGATHSAAGAYTGAITSVELPARAASALLPQLLLGWGLSLLQCRKLMSILGFLVHLVMTLALVALLLSSTSLPLSFTALFGLLKASQAFHAGGYYANYLDLTADYSGLLSGVGNTIATAAGVLFPWFASWSLEWSGEWILVMVSLMLVDVAAIIAISLGLSVDSLDTKLTDEAAASAHSKKLS